MAAGLVSVTDAVSVWLYVFVPVILTDPPLSVPLLTVTDTFFDVAL